MQEYKERQCSRAAVELTLPHATVHGVAQDSVVVMTCLKVLEDRADSEMRGPL